MRRTLQHLLFILALMLLLAPSALAGQREGAFSLTPMIGYHVFEGDQHTEDDMAYGLTFGYNLTKNWTIEADVRYTPTETSLGKGANQDLEVWTGSLNALYHFNPDGPFVPYLAAGFGGMVFEVDEGGPGDDDEDYMMNAGAGFKYFFSEDLALRADVRYIADLNSGRRYDQGGGSADEFDNNFMAMAGLTWQFGGSAPVPPAPVDSDMDGVPDNRDKCPGTPLGVAVDAVGCPPAPPKPAPAPVAKPAPVPPPVVAAPAPAPMAKEIITLNLIFDFDKATIKPEMIPVLEQALRILKEDPAATFLVMGHTCSIGSDQYNLRLSKHRAIAVKNWLTANGIAAGRLEETGYGETQPKFDNKTEEGRKLNRRVEIQTR